MTDTPQVPPLRVGAQFSDPRRRRIYTRLLHVGQGPADFYLDFCAILAEPLLRSSSHLAAHLLREIESALRDVLVPSDFKAPKGSGHRAEIEAALASMGLEQDGELAEGWKRLAGEDPLASRAHRDNLAQPRPLSDDTRAAFSAYEAVLDGVLERLEAKFLDFVGVVDSLLEKNPLGREMRKALEPSRSLRVR